MYQPFIKSNGGQTIYSESLNDARKQMLDMAAANGVDPSDAFSANNIPKYLAEIQKQNTNEEYGGANGQAANAKMMSQFMQQVSMMTANRGVNKALQTPAQMNGVYAQYPQYFGMQAKQPIPYQKVITDKNNLNAVLKGYQEVTSASGGPAGQDTANIIAKLKRSENLISSTLSKPQNDSIFSNVPRSAAANLYNIAIKNQREGSLYALQ